MQRRTFTKLLATAAVAGPVLSGATVRAAQASRKFTLDLCPGTVGIDVNQRELIELAASNGFESIQPMGEFLASLDDAVRTEIVAQLGENKLVWGAGGVSVDFRNDETTFQSQLKQLPPIAAALNKCGVTRVGTWLSPTSASLTYMENFRLHVRRLSEIASILGDNNLRLGLEYVGPKTLWASKQHPFIHTMAETKDLLAEINKSNVGFILDSWHWYTAGESVDDLKSLNNDQIIAVDLNDAPAGLERDEQIDNRRELPCATGVIDLKAFLGTLVEIGFDGPIRAEPFNQKLNDMNNEAAAEATSKAMKEAFALV